MEQLDRLSAPRKRSCSVTSGGRHSEDSTASSQSVNVNASHLDGALFCPYGSCSRTLPEGFPTLKDLAEHAQSVHPPDTTSKTFEITYKTSGTPLVPTPDEVKSETEKWSGVQNTLGLNRFPGGSWSGKGSDAAFGKGENLPLIEDRFPGRGAFADVHQVDCKGVKLARKRVYVNRRLTIDDVKKELSILKPLQRQQHIIHLVGSYTQERTFGILLWPVAICDLSKFLECVDGCETPDDDLWQQFGSPSDSDSQDFQTWANKKLQSMLRCIGSALLHLHFRKVRHRDLKPQNILLTRDNLYLTDFGMSRDFSDASSSMSNGIERGTYKYCAPEVARYERHGRAADIFSLGCIFLEMTIVRVHMEGFSLIDLDSVRARGPDLAFQANHDRLVTFRQRFRQAVENSWRFLSFDHFGMQMQLVGRMMTPVASQRPTILNVMEELGFLRGKRPLLGKSPCNCVNDYYMMVDIMADRRETDPYTRAENLRERPQPYRKDIRVAQQEASVDDESRGRSKTSRWLPKGIRERSKGAK